MCADLISRESDKLHDSSKVIDKPEPSKVCHLLRAPYDIRQEIYNRMYPAGESLQLTQGPKAWASQRPSLYSMKPEALALLSTCRQINDEVVQMLYGTNSFLLSPGCINYHKRLRYPHANSELWMSQLRLSVQLKIKKLQLFLDALLPYHPVDRLIAGLVDFPMVEIAVVALGSLRVRSGAMTALQDCLHETCRKIAMVRAHKTTVWDDSKDAQTAFLLPSALPAGYLTVH